MSTEIRRVTDPGKFEGEDMTTLVAYEFALQESDVISDGNGGESYTLVGKASPDFTCDTEINQAEREFIISKAGCIVRESSDGFVTCEWFDDSESLESAWTNIESDFAEFSESKEDDMQDDVVDSWIPRD